MERLCSYVTGIKHSTIERKKAWLRIQAFDPSACINRLMALEGAIEGVKKNLLPDEVKEDLKAYYQEHRK